MMISRDFGVVADDRIGAVIEPVHVAVTLTSSSVPKSSLFVARLRAVKITPANGRLVVRQRRLTVRMRQPMKC